MVQLKTAAGFYLDVVTAVAKVWGGEPISIKLSLSNTSYTMRDSNPLATFGYVIQGINSFGLAYLHLMEAN